MTKKSPKWIEGEQKLFMILMLYREEGYCRILLIKDHIYKCEVTVVLQKCKYLWILKHCPWKKWTRQRTDKSLEELLCGYDCIDLYQWLNNSRHSPSLLGNQVNLIVINYKWFKVIIYPFQCGRLSVKPLFEIWNSPIISIHVGDC